MAKNNKKQSDKPYLRTPIQLDEKITREEFMKKFTASINYCKKNVLKTNTFSDTELLNLKGEALKHRADVLWDYLKDVVIPKYGEHIFEDELAGIWAHVNTFAPGPANLDAEKRIMLGAAIWVLDHADISDESDADVKRMLERAWEEADSSFDDDYVWDGSHSADMITSVKYILSARNRDTDKRAFENKNYWTAYTAQKKPESDEQKGPHRKDYERLLGIIPKEDIEHAVTKFEAYCWEWMDHMISLAQPLFDECKKHLTIYNELCVKSNEVVESIIKVRNAIEKTKPNGKKIADSAKAPAIKAPIMLPNIMQDTFAPRELFPAHGLSQMMPPELNAISMAWNELELLTNEAENINNKCREESRLIDGISANAINVVDSTLGACNSRQDLLDYHEKKCLDIEDPYEACFAMLYMVDTNHDMSWLRGPFFGAGHEAGGTLPWGFGKFHDDYSPAYDEYTGKENPADIPDVYKRAYTTKEDDGIQRNIAQFLYSATGCIIPRCMDSFDAAASEMRKRGVKGKNMTFIMAMMSVMYAAKNKQSVFDIADGEIDEGFSIDYDFDDEDDNDAKVSALTAQNEEYKTEIARLKTALHDAERSLRDTKREKEKQDRKFAANIRELADLREIIFNRDNEDEDTNQRTTQTVTEDSFPYEVKKTTVVFGGHETWLKAIKPRLEGDIRFIAGDISSFDENVIRGADVIWVQPNAIKHRVFYKITNVTRANNIPMRYFTNASAFLSAVQLMEYDEEK